MKLAFLDAEGNEIKAFTSKAERTKAADPTDEEEEEEKQDPNVPNDVGLNRFVWNMRYPDPRKVDGYVASEGAMSGPVIAPGTYQVRIQATSVAKLSPLAPAVTLQAAWTGPLTVP